jgi:hypothetical protein
MYLGFHILDVEEIIFERYQLLSWKSTLVQRVQNMRCKSAERTKSQSRGSLGQILLGLIDKPVCAGEGMVLFPGDPFPVRLGIVELVDARSDEITSLGRWVPHGERYHGKGLKSSKSLVYNGKGADVVRIRHVVSRDKHEVVPVIGEQG